LVACSPTHAQPEYLFVGIMSCCSTGGCYSSLRSKEHPNGVILGLQIGEKEEIELACLTLRCCFGAKDNLAPLPLFPSYAKAKTNDKILEISIPCLQLGLKQPEVLMSGSANLCCVHVAVDLPNSGKQVPEQVCACCFLRFKPGPEKCCVVPFGGAPDLASMTRT
jgi:hypothetical protein